MVKFLKLFRPRTKSGREIPADFLRQYEDGLSLFSRESSVGVYRDFRFDAFEHPKKSIDYECEFASNVLAKLPASASILDVGSYRQFVIGLMSARAVTTLDVRKVISSVVNETVITADATKIPVPDNTFDAITTLCAIEHFGLGRYGDAIDVDADVKVFAEFARVLKPAGRLIFTTTFTRGTPAVAFNANRIYDRAGIERLCAGLNKEEEMFFSVRQKMFVPYEEVTSEPKEWDIYCGSWIK